MVMLLLTTGLRRSELLSLRRVDLSSDLSELRVVGKGNRERAVPIPAQTRKALHEYLTQQPEPSEYLFPNRVGRQMGTTTFARMFRRIVARAGLAGSGITPHSLRHAYATQLLHSGVDIKTVQELLGHADLSTTSRYLHSDAHTKQAAVETLPSFDAGHLCAWKDPRASSDPPRNIPSSRDQPHRKMHQTAGEVGADTATVAPSQTAAVSLVSSSNRLANVPGNPAASEHQMGRDRAGAGRTPSAYASSVDSLPSPVFQRAGAHAPTPRALNGQSLGERSACSGSACSTSADGVQESARCGRWPAGGGCRERNAARTESCRGPEKAAPCSVHSDRTRQTRDAGEASDADRASGYRVLARC